MERREREKGARGAAKVKPATGRATATPSRDQIRAIDRRRMHTDQLAPAAVGKQRNRPKPQRGK